MSRTIRLFSLTFAIAFAVTSCSQPAPTPTPSPVFTPAVTFVPPGTPDAQPKEVIVSPTPRPLGAPILVDRSPVRGEELALDKPLELTFDQAMDKESMSKALVVRVGGEAVNGTLAWQGDNVVTFTPEKLWKRETSYNVSLGVEAKSAKGLGLARAESFVVNTIGKLSVAQTLPADNAQDVNADSSITIIFNRPVVPLTSIAGQVNFTMPLVFEPSIEGSGQWLNTSIYVFKPSQPLVAGTSYKGTVGAGLQDTTGALLDTSYSWMFSAASPTVKFVAPVANANQIDLRQPISVTFSQKMDHASAEAAFTIEPSINGSFRWADEKQPEQSPFEPREPLPQIAIAGGGTSLLPPLTPSGEVMAFIPSENFSRDTAYTIRVAGGAKSVNGASATQNEFRSSFTTIPLPAVVSTEPLDGTPNAEAGGFSIRFSAPISPETIIRNLTFAPALSLTNVYSYYDEYNNQFYLSVNLKPSTNYRVKIGGNISDKYGAKIGKDTEVRFTTRPLQPFVAFQTQGLVGTYNANNATELFVNYRNVTEINFSLAKLSPQDFFDFTGAQNSYDNLTKFKPSGNQILREWKFTGKANLNETGAQRIPLEASGGALPTGVYLLKATAPEVLALDPNAPPSLHIVIVSRLHSTLKRGEKKALVWATDLASGAPIASANVSLRGKDFNEIGKGTTEGGELNGQALIDLPDGYNLYDPLYAVVGEAGQANFGIIWSELSQGIQPYDFALPTRYQTEPYYAYLYTDRPIYRPGQMAFFKGVARKEDDARYTLDPTLIDLKPYVTVFSPQGQQVFSQSVTLNASGTFSGEFAIDNAAPTGYYNIQLCIPKRIQDSESTIQNAKLPPSPEALCSYFNVGFIVATYRRPEFEVNLVNEKEDYLAGETFKATLSAKYFFGGNVNNAKVRWNLLANDYAFDRYDGEGNYSFSDFDFFLRGAGFNQSIANGEGTTDSQGNLTISIPADLSKTKGSVRYTLEVSVVDANDQSVSARTSAIIHKGSFYLGIAPTNYVGVVGQEQTMNLLSVDWFGKPVADKAGEVKFYRRQWFTTQQEDQFGNREFTSVPSDTLVSTVSITTDAEGKSTASFTPEQGGEYRVVAEGLGAAVSANYVWVSSVREFVPWQIGNHDRIELQADKKSYQVGETAKILVPSPFQGVVNALLTIERGNFLSRKSIVLNSNSEVLEIPIDPSYAPNAYISVLMVKGVDATNTTPAFKLGYAQFLVDAKQFALNVEVKSDKPSYAPRDTATYDIRVTDNEGKPVQAEVSVAVVDKSVLSLVDPNSAKLLDAFYGLRQLSVRTADTLSINVDRINKETSARLAASAKGGGGGGGDAASDAAFTRQNFKDTAFWTAVVNTDAEGNARVQVPLPDNLTTWTLDARAVTPDTKVGEGKAEIVTSKPLLIRPVTPRFFVVGDSVTLGAVVNNNTDAALEADVALEGSGFTFTGDAFKKVSVPAKGNARVDWSVSILDASSASMTFTVKAGALQDSSIPGLATANGGIPILHYVAPETVATAGDVSEPGAKIEVIALPKRLDTGKGELSINIDTSLGAAALKSANALEEYPFESTEWTAARLLVNMSLKRAAIGGRTPNDASSEASISQSIQRLFVEQHPDGGWGWWINDPSNPIVTANVLLALSRAKQAGYTIDENLLQRARDYLNQHFTPASELPNESAANRQAFMAYVMSESGAPDGGRIGALYEQREKLSHYAKALLALAMSNLQKDDTRIKTLMNDIYAAAVTSATGVSWQERAFDAENFGSNVRSTAIILDAISRLDAQNALAPNVVRWLMVAREGETWQTTQESVWSILALTDWMNASGEKNPAYQWRVGLNDNDVLRGDAAKNTIDSPSTTQSSAQENLSEATLKIEVAKLLRDQSNTLAFERGAGDGRLYYTARLKSFLPVEDLKAINRGVIVARKYESADCVPSEEKICEAISSAKIDQNIRVRLTIVAPNDLHFVHVSDPLPGGAEAVDTTLKTSASIQNAKQTTFGFGGEFGFGWWWFSNTDVRDDRVDLFASRLPRGTYEYTYLIRPSIVGEFKIMPTHAEQQYFPEVFGRSNGAKLVVTR